MKEKTVDQLWSHLHWLTVLHQQGSFTAAATRLNVSKAAMSQHIAELEAAAGVALVQRTTRSVRLTEAGERLVAQTREPFERIATSLAGVRDRAGAPQGLLRVTAPVAFSRQQLVPRLPAFLQAHPGVQLELDMSDRLRPLAMDGFDIAVRHSNAPPETHVAWTLCATRVLLVASPAHLAVHGTPATPADLAGHTALHYPRSPGGPAGATWTFVRAASAARRRGAASAQATLVTVPITGPLAANNSEALRDAAIAGLGVALLPDFSAQSALQAGTLVELLPQWQSTGAFGEWLYAIRPYSPHVPLAVQAFVAYLREAFGPGFS
jgi:DNA-binding transcriptional LysR family regulator